MQNSRTLTVTALPGMPMFAAGMDVAAAIVAAPGGDCLADGDVVVIAQKIVSKAEGRTVALAGVVPGAEALEIAVGTARPAAMAQLILDESSGILRATPAAVIARHRTGHVLANAGIDASNVAGGEAGTVLLWPVDPDASARAIRAGLRARTGARVGVVIADSMGRAWRVGTVGAAIGCAGLAVLEDRRGKAQDLYGRTLQATVIAVADAIAGMAVLAMGEGAEGTPVAVVRGAGHWVSEDDGPGAVAGLRPVAEDMFR
ncbi:MAG: coenzyme F420-0:L-glutamate ligase [Sphingomonadales bacterium]|nr:coenzyme F420-0:L-glutamate ligase [Sphingomonadales bacterium]